MSISINKICQKLSRSFLCRVVENCRETTSDVASSRSPMKISGKLHESSEEKAKTEEVEIPTELDDFSCLIRRFVRRRRTKPLDLIG